MDTLSNGTIHHDALPLVSIVTLSYNSVRYLPECIENCLAQSYSNLDIVVVDDGSSDDTREVLEPYLKMATYCYQGNTGLAGVRNTRHHIAHGKCVAWLDADDIAHPERISLQVSYLENAGRVKVYVGDGRFY